MAKLVFGMNVSLDGYVDYDRFSPDPELFEYFVEQTKHGTGSIYGRRLYEIMRYWDADDPGWDAPSREFATAWRRIPKWVVSRSLTSVGPNATLIGEDFEAVIRKLKAELDGDLDVGGPKLAGSLSTLGLIDEYQLILHPVVLGHGDPFFVGTPPPLRLVSSERIGQQAIRLSYVPA